MKAIVTHLLVIMLFIAPANLLAQDDLFDLFGEEEAAIEYTFATFKTSRVVYGQSVESPAAGNLLFLIQHNFGELNSGAYELFGLDRATIRLGLEYGINDYLAVGLGRSAWEKTYDGFVKLKLLRQSSGARHMPVSISYYANMAVNSLKWQYPDRTNYFSSRLSYVHQVLIARKFGESFSFQLSPSIIHKNLVPTLADKNTSYAVGFGGRLKLTSRMTFNAEYFYYPDDQTTLTKTDIISLGFDIETGGHVFQLHISNGQPMFERAFITETTGKWGSGDVYFGFNISRNFVIVKPEAFR
jgi:opacity protein-like surface antigen